MQRGAVRSRSNPQVSRIRTAGRRVACAHHPAASGTPIVIGRVDAQQGFDEQELDKEAKPSGHRRDPARRARAESTARGAAAIFSFRRTVLDIDHDPARIGQNGGPDAVASRSARHHHEFTASKSPQLDELDSTETPVRSSRRAGVRQAPIVRGTWSPRSRTISRGRSRSRSSAARSRPA